jgi:hypothetical protein
MWVFVKLISRGVETLAAPLCAGVNALDSRDLKMQEKLF